MQLEGLWVGGGSCERCSHEVAGDMLMLCSWSGRAGIAAGLDGTCYTVLWALEGQCRDVPGGAVEQSSTHAPCWANLACRNLGERVVVSSKCCWAMVLS